MANFWCPTGVGPPPMCVNAVKLLVCLHNWAFEPIKGETSVTES
jgi:hypothetical protein